jgi:hypothetical protein
MCPLLSFMLLVFSSKELENTKFFLAISFMSNVALIIVFNHRYDKNIDVLEQIYKGRFSRIYHLVPFYDGDKPNVIPVFESSFYFQGYFAQGLKTFFDEQCEHYFFAADDLILNPAINENNYKEYFKLGAGSSYIPEVFNLHKLTNNNTLRFENFYDVKGNLKYYWWRIKDAVGYHHQKEGVEIDKVVPSYEDAEKRLQEHGFPVQPVVYSDVHGRLFPLSFSTKHRTKRVARHIRSFATPGKKYPLSYPLVCSYSDIVIVSKDTIKKFCAYCGAFAANELFVEFAVPTALLLSSSNVVTEIQIGARGEIYWTYEKHEAMNYEEVMKPYGYDLHTLIQKFPRASLYIHPIKLSKWKTGSL